MPNDPACLFFNAIFAPPHERPSDVFWRSQTAEPPNRFWTSLRRQISIASKKTPRVRSRVHAGNCFLIKKHNAAKFLATGLASP
jgi:hypothetical protein